MTIEPLELGIGMIARTLVELEGSSYEVMTLNTTEALDAETIAFWKKLLEENPYETTVYKLVDANKPFTAIEQKLADLAPVNSKWRRDLETGDLYCTRMPNQDAAALEHDSVINEFRSNTILLLTAEERNAIYGPGRLL